MAPNGLRVSGAAPINGNHIVADTEIEKRPILLDAKRRPLHARVGLAFLVWRSLVSNYAAFSRPAFIQWH
jgi:hypothetical protein